MFTGFARGHDVPDLDFSVGDNHAIDQEFYQLPSLLKSSSLQPWPDSLAEVLNRAGQPGQFFSPVHLGRQLFLLFFQGLGAPLQIASPPPVFFQQHNSSQIGFRQAVQLLDQTGLSPAQTFLASL
jgi:hypothetical protein